MKPRTLYKILFLFTVMLLTSCGYSALKLASFVYQDNGWACANGSHNAEPYMMKAAFIGFLLDIALGLCVAIFVYKKTPKAWLRIGIAIWLFFYFAVTIVVSFQFAWLADRSVECGFNFRINGHKILSHYSHVFNKKDDPQKSGEYVAEHCAAKRGRILNAGDIELMKDIVREYRHDKFILEKQNTVYGIFELKNNNLKEISTEETRWGYCIIP